MRRITLIRILLATGLLAALVIGQPYELRSQSTISLGADDVVSVLIHLGANDTAPRAWDGSLSVSGGELLGLRDWSPRPGHEVSGSSFKLASYQGPNFTR